MSRHRNGNSGTVSDSFSLTKWLSTWPCRWLTSTIGICRPSDKPLANEVPTSSEPEQSGAACERYGAEVGLGDAGAAQCGVDDRHDVLLVGARCQFGHYAAKFFMYALRCDDVGQQQAVAYHGCGGVVAR